MNWSDHTCGEKQFSALFLGAFAGFAAGILFMFVVML